MLAAMQLPKSACFSESLTKVLTISFSSVSVESRIYLVLWGSLFSFSTAALPAMCLLG